MEDEKKDAKPAEKPSKPRRTDHLKEYQFKPGGPSGNPGGRPKAKGLAAKVRAATNDGQAVVDFMWKMLNGEIPKSTAHDRLDAAKWLSERGHGKVPDQMVNLDGNAEMTEAAADLSAAELKDLARMVKEERAELPKADA